MVFGKLAALLRRDKATTPVESRPQKAAQLPNPVIPQRYATGKTHAIIKGSAFNAVINEAGRTLVVMENAMLGFKVYDRDNIRDTIKIEEGDADKYLEVGEGRNAVVRPEIYPDGTKQLVVYSVYDLRAQTVSEGLGKGEKIFVSNGSSLFEIGRDEVSGGHYLRPFNETPLNPDNLLEESPNMTQIKVGNTIEYGLFIQRSVVHNLRISMAATPGPTHNINPHEIS